MTKKTEPPWLDHRFGVWEVNPGESLVQVNVGCNQPVVIDKLYGPLAANPVRIRLEYTEVATDWVVECELGDIWTEMARFDCQLDWDKKGVPRG
jgi:hypothetical protein